MADDRVRAVSTKIYREEKEVNNNDAEIRWRKKNGGNVRVHVRK